MAEEQLKALVTKRAAVKSRLTRFHTFFSKSENANNVMEIRERLQGLNSCLSEFEGYHWQINSLNSEKATDADLQNFEDEYYRIISACKNFLNTKTGARQGPSADEPPIAAEKPPTVKLPEIKLPTFSGSLTEWISFRETFANLIHDTELPAVQKLHYLRGSLQGDAKQTVEHLTPSADNYASAWALLEQRYENPRLITQHHVRALFSLPQIHGKDAKLLRSVITTLNSNLKALENMKRPVNQWDDLLVHLISSKFDQPTTIAWENTLTNASPSQKEIIDFLTKRCQMWESYDVTTRVNQHPFKINKNSGNNRTISHIVSPSVKPLKCSICRQGHHIYGCPRFLALSPEQRMLEIKKLQLCINCLRGGHRSETCNSSNCRSCNKRHNTLLHVNQISAHNEEPQPSTSALTSSAETSTSLICSTVFLSTAIVNVCARGGNNVQLRALLDNGSASNFVTEEAIKKLKLNNVKNVNIAVSGIGGIVAPIKRFVKIQFTSAQNAYSSELNCLVVPKITGNIPTVPISAITGVPENIRLADPAYNVPNKIDLLIGNELFWELICVGQIQMPNRGPILQKTQLGWIINGPSRSNPVPAQIPCNISNIELHDAVQTFFNLENCGENTIDNSNNLCEDIFTKTFSRTALGRFQVKLPFRDEPPLLGNSYDRVCKMFLNLERRLQRDPIVREQYKEFMANYKSLGHMVEVLEPDHTGYFVPHHAVINEASLTTKLRVVFNASFKTTNNKSINDHLLVGPALQPELYETLIRFRTYPVAITADIQKMYRQILLHPEHQKYQQIPWRDDSTEPIKIYKLQTVTYGFASSSFLATRCLEELAKIAAAADLPNAARAIRRDFYVDDLLTGADTEIEAIQLLKEVKSILRSGGFELHKIMSNRPNISDTSQISSNNTASLDKQEVSKTLGVLWDRNSDQIKFETANNPSPSQRITKRTVLSAIARIFDPLGLVAPVTVAAKIILQKLWSLKLDWDESLPAELHTQWCQFINTFSELNHIEIPRLVLHQREEFQIHGFCDASQNAYGACIYLRSLDAQGHPQTKLLCSKNRVAPLKSVTIPRMELCAALLLARLIVKVRNTLNLSGARYHLWSDSTIVLAWLRLEPTRLKVFVSNRVSEIQSATNVRDWHHVPSSQNPADILSRGTTPALLSKSRWLTGPEFLSLPNCEIPAFNVNAESMDDTTLPELKTICCLRVMQPSQFELWTRFSSFQKLIRVTALILRFKNNCLSKTTKRTGPLNNEELNQAHDTIIKATQSEALRNEIHELKGSKEIPKSSKIAALSPFIDDNGLLRVGGRLRNSSLSEWGKHQLILPKDHPVTRLIITRHHIEGLHSGCQATLGAVRYKYWPISGRTIVRKLIFNCLNCYKTKPRQFDQFMADLPADRVTPSRPFSIVGVDYAGPFALKNGFGRTQKTMKAYIAIFVCFATRAVHIEVVCECSSSAFLNTLKRFIARRGKPAKILSDNGKNFVGANRHLQQLRVLLRDREFRAKLHSATSNDGIEWHFIPPHAPHMGGLWESAVKSAKSHLKRVIGETLLNYEEINTLLTMVEACMNSRPITPLSNDPNDPQPLTPGHFLIGAPLTAPNEPGLDDQPRNRLNRYQLVERLRHEFWKRWSREYLATLQARSKWRQHPGKRPCIGDLVILKEDNTAPLHWPMGRIVDLHPGSDGQCRVVSIKTVRGVYKRPITKVCAVPLDS